MPSTKAEFEQVHYGVPSGWRKDMVSHGDNDPSAHLFYYIDFAIRCGDQKKCFG